MRLSRSPIAVAALFSVLSLLGVACGEEQTVQIKPQLWVEADLSSSGSLAFGSVPVGGSGERTVIFHALNTAPVRIESLNVKAGDASSAAAFHVEPAPPFVVPGNGKVEVKIFFEPDAVRSYLAQASFRTNAKDRAEVDFPLVGEGVEGKLEIAACDPARCDATKVFPPDSWHFGEVRGGSFRKVRISLFNGGGDVIRIDSVELEGDGPRFRLPEGMDQGKVLASGEGTHFDVEFDPTPDQEGLARVEVVARTDSETYPELRMELLADVKPNTAPEACLFVSEIRRHGAATEVLQPGDPLPVIEPADEVILDVLAKEGCTGDAEDPIAELRMDWKLTEGPGIRPPDLMNVVGSPLKRSLTPDLVGTYSIQLTVTDSLGLSDVATLDLEVSFARDIAVEMAWPDSPRVDLDLHLVRAGADVFDEFNDAYYGNFKNGSGPRWPGGSPVLLFDDQGTAGQFETITLNGAERGQVYDVYVHTYEDKRSRNTAATCSETSPCTGGLVCSVGRCMAPVGVEARIYLKGVAPRVFEGEVHGPCDTWHVGRITWPNGGGAPSFSVVDTRGVEGILDGVTCTPPQ